MDNFIAIFSNAFYIAYQKNLKEWLKTDDAEIRKSLGTGAGKVLGNFLGV